MILRLTYLVLLGGALISLLNFVPHGDVCSRQREAEELINELSFRKEKEHFLHLMNLIEDVEGPKEIYYFEVCRALRYFHDIPGFRHRDYLQKQVDLLSSAVRSTLLIQRGKISNVALQSPSKRIIHFSTTGIYKDRPTPFLEVICWDLALLFECDAMIAPTCRGIYQGKEYLYQPFISARIHNHILQSTQKFSRRSERIDLITFWKANEFFTLIGHQDLVPFNIPITKRGIPVLWDNEISFPSTNKIRVFQGNEKLEIGFPFINVLLDYPQALVRIDKQDALEIQKLMRLWKSRKEDLKLYLNHPYTIDTLSDEQRAALFERLDWLSNEKHIKNNPSFRVFVKKLFPNLFIGAQEAAEIIGEIIDYPLTEMSAVYFIHRCREWWDPFTEDDQRKCEKWIEKNHLLKVQFSH